MRNILLKKKELTNASWLISGRIIQMIIALFVSILTARYLGPKNYGLISYASAYVTFFTALCNLGINSIIVKEFIDYPTEQGVTLGTTIGLRFISSLLSVIMILIIVNYLDRNERLTIIVTLLCSISLIFQIFDSINYWFQSRYQSKITSIITVLAYIFVSIYKLILLSLKKDIKWFAFAGALDFICIGIFLCFSYKKYGGPKFSFCIKKAKSLLGRSYHYILSGIMVSIYGQTDRLMLKQMLNETEVGYYSIAVSICSMWVFMLVAIIDSIAPTIMKLHKENKYEFEKKNKQLYAIVFYISIFVSLIFSILGNLVVSLLYGQEYEGAGILLKIITWYTAFSYLGVARNIWLVCENKQKYLKYIYSAAVIINIILNFILIKVLGASGAAIASLITQMCTSIILPLFFKELKKNAKLMLEGIMLKDVF